MKLIRDTASQNRQKTIVDGSIRIGGNVNEVDLNLDSDSSSRNQPYSYRIRLSKEQAMELAENLAAHFGKTLSSAPMG